MIYKITEIDGDMTVGRDIYAGGKMNVRGSMTVGHTMKVDGWLDAPNVKGGNKGLFLTEEALKEAYPKPEAGWYAGVGTGTPFAGYVVENGEWVLSGGTIEIDPDTTALLEEMDEKVDLAQAYAEGSPDITGAKQYAEEAGEKAQEAGSYARNSADSASDSATSVRKAQAYAEGSPDITGAKQYAEEAEAARDEAAGSAAAAANTAERIHSSLEEIDTLKENMGYYECTTEGATADKVVSGVSYTLPSNAPYGGCIKVMFSHANSAESPTLSIGGAAAKPLYYDGMPASESNTWADGETVEVYYDGAYFQANNVAGGGNFATGEKVRETGIDDEPTAGSDNLVKSRGVADNLGYTIESSDYIRLITDKKNHLLFGIKINGDIEWGKGVPAPVKNYINQKIDELGLDKINDIVAFIDGLEIEGKTLAELLYEKVDKDDGKGLIDNQYVEEGEHDELIKATCDAEGKVLQGIKADGKPYFPHNEMMEVDEIFGYHHVVLDNDDKIVEGIDEEGKHIFNAGIEVGQLKTESGIESGDWLDVKTDHEGRILEGINKDGEKHISKFDKTTQELIKDFVGGSAGSNYISIPVLDGNFISPVPVEITGTKGNEDAKYVFDLPLSEDAFNIRFRFRITENILNKEKTAVIAKLGDTDAVIATPVKLQQLVTTATYNEEQKNCYWGTLAGGISLNNSSVNRVSISFGKQNIGLFAFYVKYIGNEDEAYIENDGSKFVVRAGNNTTNYPFSEYETVYALYSALRDRTDLEVSYNETENRMSTELAVFSECKIKGLFYSGIDENTTIQEYMDNAPFFVPYAVCEEWHRVEIIKIANTIYVLCDGVQKTIVADANTLTLGGECGVLFKDFEVHTDNAYDAEVSDGIVISSMNPYILIHEGHGIDKVPTGDGAQTDNMATTVDRLQYIYSIALSKGYKPVSIEHIADYYAGIKELPKRCFTVIFDDYRFVNCMDIDNRAVFTRLGIKPALAVISDREESITHNGETIELAKAVDICRMNNFSLVSHTRNHRRVVATKPSTYMQEFVNDIYNADIKGVDGRIIVYPYGVSNSYEHDTLKWLGVRLGISIYEGATPRYNTYNRIRYRLVRQEIGFRIGINNILSHLL